MHNAIFYELNTASLLAAKGNMLQMQQSKMPKAQKLDSLKRLLEHNLNVIPHNLKRTLE